MAPAKRKKKPGRPPGKGDTTSTTFRLPKDLLEKLHKAAEAQDRTQTAIVRRALEAFLAAQEAPEG